MLTFFATLGVWDWLIAGGVLLVMEVLAPGVFMLWFVVMTFPLLDHRDAIYRVC
jgi:membrane protein implicated in regulation of membrane protease activity